MGKVFSMAALTAVWVILAEGLTWRNVLTGLIISTIALFFIAKFLPLKEISNVNFYKLATYPFYLIGQIYLAGFHVIKIILSGPKVDIVTVPTKIKAEALKIILVDSITLTPGSVLLELNDDKITLLWIRDKKSPNDPKAAEEQLKAKLERRLLKAQKP
ncbi:MAG: Na+/H+ antiporter subunit E [Defluviitaleaceae bacterium]|nr:Na+/H+ antiporter subunit E [Defluviitaleaceae bacterium]MCL2836723.1 Na+/H+ antiporter subunit E [Defluviitaleaceae bacterium]